jgi:hypothetical protein
MRCLRCQGFMEREWVFTRQGGIPMMRCLHCGDWIDSVVIAHRKMFRSFEGEPERPRLGALSADRHLASKPTDGNINFHLVFFK